MYPTIFDILCDLNKYKINPNRFDKLWQKHRMELGKRVSFFDGREIPPASPQLSSIPEACCVLEVQSGEDATTSDNSIFKAGTKSEYENVQFSDQHDPYEYDVESALDPTRKLQDTSDTSLADFFSRPIKIAEEEWITGASLDFDFNPWALYFNNPRVTNRITNYNLLRANLRVKVLINGNGFQYGRMMMSYLPLAFYDSLSTMSSLVREDLVQGSQMPHIFIDPTTSTGGEMKLPFFWHKNYLDIPNADWDFMGRLFFRTLNPLAHANGATDKATVTVFVWAEDVETSVLTSVDTTTLTPQSGEIEEANKTGMVSGPATTVAKYAAYMSGVPYIGPFATATEIGAGAVASMAKIFGYCRPTITKTQDEIRPNFVSSLALTNVPDHSQKLTIDDKQELTIDPRIAGIGPADPLNVREIAKRESYLTTFAWNIGTAPDTLLWNSRIDPVTWAENTTGTTSYHFPACAFAAMPFDYWKGSMKFRFQIVCSAFHKGRLKIVYDPNWIDSSTYLTFSEYNTNYLKVVDISEEQDFTIEVGMGQEYSFLPHARPGVDPVTNVYSTTRYAVGGKGNGVIGVLVVNELTTPNSTVSNDIQVNVFVSMGDDFEVAVPSSDIANFVLTPQMGTILEPQSGIVPESMDTDEPNAPQHSQTTIVGLPPVDDSNLNKVFFGESVVSLRPLLKRFALWNRIPKTGTAARIVSARFPMFPYFRGNVTGAVDGTLAATSYNYCNTLLLHWVRSAYQGWRGTIRYKLVPTGYGFSENDYVSVQRAPLVAGDPSYAFNVTNYPVYTSTSSARADVVQQYEALTVSLPKYSTPLPGSLGMAIANMNVNSCLEFELPYYSVNRFTPGKTVYLTGPQTFEAPWDFRSTYTFSNGQTDLMNIDMYTAGGEDLQFYFFTGLPRMYYESTIPVPI